MARDVPGSVANAVRVLGLIVATSGVITLLIVLAVRLIERRFGPAGRR